MKRKNKKIASLDKKDKRNKKGRAEWDSFETHSFIKTPEGVKKRNKNRQMMEAQGQMNVSVALCARMFLFLFFPHLCVVSSFSVSEHLQTTFFYLSYSFY